MSSEQDKNQKLHLQEEAPPAGVLMEKPLTLNSGLKFFKPTMNLSSSTFVPTSVPKSSGQTAANGPPAGGGLTEMNGNNMQ